MHYLKIRLHKNHIYLLFLQQISIHKLNWNFQFFKTDYSNTFLFYTSCVKIFLTMISKIKARTDKDIPIPKIKKALTNSRKEKGAFLVLGWSSVRHLSLVGMFLFFQCSTIPAAFARRVYLKVFYGFNLNQVILWYRIKNIYTRQKLRRRDFQLEILIVISKASKQSVQEKGQYDSSHWLWYLCEQLL